MQAEEALPWSAWRGTSGEGLAHAARPPTSWAPGEELWRTEIEGDGLSSPIVVHDRVFLTNAQRADGPSMVTGVLLSLLAFAAWRWSLPLARAPLSRLATRSAAVWTAFACAWSLALVSDFHWEMTGLSGVLLALLAGSVTLGRGAGRVLAACLCLGGVCALGGVLPGRAPERHAYLLTTAMLLVAHVAWSSRGAPERRDGERTNLDGLVWSGLVAILVSVLGDDAYWRETTAQNAWMRSSYLLAPALGAALFGCTPSRLGRIAGLLGLAAMVAWSAPGNMLDRPANWATRATIAGPFLALMAPALATMRFRSSASRWDSMLLFVTAATAFVSANHLRPGNRIVQQLLCFDLDSGDLRWKRELFRVDAKRLDTYRTSHATPTCCSDGEVVIAHFGNGTACVGIDGEILWLVERPWFGEAALYGAGASPLIHDGLVVTIQECERPATGLPSEVTAYRIDSGELAWRLELPEGRSSYCTPIRVRGAGETLLITSTWRTAIAIDPSQGRLRWSLPIDVEELVASPVSDGSHVYISGGEMRGGTYALRIPSAGEQPELAWSSRGVRAGCASPLLHGDRLYVLEENGLLCCLSTEDGAPLWEERLPVGEYSASLCGSDGMLFATSTEGRTTVVAMEDDFSILGQGTVDEPVLASPALAPGILLVRGARSLWCFGERGRSSSGR